MNLLINPPELYYIQVNDYEIIVNFFTSAIDIQHSSIVHKFTNNLNNSCKFV